MSNLDYVVKAINKTLDPEKIILFGSSLSKKGNDLDVAVVQKSKPTLGQKAEVFLALEKLGYGWDIEPDIHIFSSKDFEKKLTSGDLFVKEVSKGRTIYAQ
ncbi:MAG: hypothetical protein AAB656_04655 [Patescibacteria group bacterium]